MLSFKTSIFKVCDLSWSALASIKSWFRQDIVRDGFNLESFDNPSLKVVEVKNPTGQTVAICPVETCFLVNQIINPKANPIEAQQAGNCVDAQLAWMAQKDGATRFLIVVPNNIPTQPDEKWIRIIERKVPKIATMQSVDCAAQLTSAYIN